MIKIIQYLFLTLILFSCDNLEHRVTYFDDGKIKEEYFVDGEGRKQGVYRTYYLNGKTHEYGNYKNDLAHGLWIDYYKSGKIEQITHAKNDRFDGEVKLFTPEGKLEFYQFYDNDTVPSVEKDYNYYGQIQKIKTRVFDNNINIINTNVEFDEEGKVIPYSKYGEWKWLGKDKIEISLHGNFTLDTLHVLFIKKQSDKKSIRQFTFHKKSRFVLDITEQDYYKGKLNIILKDFIVWSSKEEEKRMGTNGFSINYYFQISKGEKTKRYNADYIKYE